MNNPFKSGAEKYNSLTLRERALIGFTVLAAIGFTWWQLYASPTLDQTSSLARENSRLSIEVDMTRAAINDIRTRIAAGVNREKDLKLAQLRRDLEAVQERLRLKTIELIDPEQMLQLMTELVYRKSNLKLLSLKRREVKPAITLTDKQQEDAGIYRHVLEVKFSGKFTDILKYIQTLEGLDWKLIWDQIEIVRQEYPQITVEVVISTLSTKKEWVGV
jgi:MSHA biogenesis protein MshJ